MTTKYYIKNENGDIWLLAYTKEQLLSKICFQAPKLVDNPKLGKKATPNVKIYETEKTIWAFYNDLMLFEDDSRFDESLKLSLEYYRQNKKLTRTDVERIIYKDLGLTLDDILTKAEEARLDPKELKIELSAQNFWRTHPMIATFGELLGYTPKQLDYMFLYGKSPLEMPEDFTLCLKY